MGYLIRYPDLQKAFGGDEQKAEQHWFEFGYKQGRNPRREEKEEINTNNKNTTDEYDVEDEIIAVGAFDVSLNVAEKWLTEKRKKIAKKEIKNENENEKPS